MIDFEDNDSFSDDSENKVDNNDHYNEPKETFKQEKKSRLPITLDKNGSGKKSSTKVPEPLSPSKLPRYPNVSKKKSDVKGNSENGNNSDEMPKKTKLNKSLSNGRMKKKELDASSDEEEDSPVSRDLRKTKESPTKSFPKSKVSSPKKSLPSKKSSNNSNKSVNDDSYGSEEDVKSKKSSTKPKVSSPKKSIPSKKTSSKILNDSDGSEEDFTSKRSSTKTKISSPRKTFSPKKSRDKNFNESDASDDDFVSNRSRKKELSKESSKKSKTSSPTKKSLQKSKSFKASDESDFDENNDKIRKSRSISPIKKSSIKSPTKEKQKPLRKSRKESSDEDDDYKETEVPSKTKRNSVSPTKSRRNMSESPVKKSENGNKLSDSSPKKRNKKDISRSEIDLVEMEEESSPRKTNKKGKLSRSKSESVSIKDRQRKQSPVKKKGRKASIKDVSDEDDEDLTISEHSSSKAQNSKPKKKTKDVIFSDEEEDSPFGISGKGKGNYWRRSTYLDILTIEKERRESIKKMKDEKDKEREKNGGKEKKKENFIRDSFGNKVYLTKGKKDAEPEAPDHIDIAVQDIVSKALIISSNANYGRNRESLISMMKRKLKEDHYLRSLCQTDEWFLKNIISAMVSFGPLMKIVTKTQALIWIFLSRLSFYWSKQGKTPPNEKDLLNDPETMAFATELCKLCYKLLVSDQASFVININ